MVFTQGLRHLGTFHKEGISFRIYIWNQVPFDMSVKFHAALHRAGYLLVLVWECVPYSLARVPMLLTVFFPGLDETPLKFYLWNCQVILSFSTPSAVMSCLLLQVREVQCFGIGEQATHPTKGNNCAHHASSSQGYSGLTTHLYLQFVKENVPW